MVWNWRVQRARSPSFYLNSARDRSSWIFSRLGLVVALLINPSVGTLRKLLDRPGRRIFQSTKSLILFDTTLFQSVHLVLRWRPCKQLTTIYTKTFIMHTYENSLGVNSVKDKFESSPGGPILKNKGKFNITCRCWSIVILSVGC